LEMRRLLCELQLLCPTKKQQPEYDVKTALNILMTFCVLLRVSYWLQKLEGLSNVEADVLARDVSIVLPIGVSAEAAEEIAKRRLRTTRSGAGYGGTTSSAAHAQSNSH
jgi:hypothetical protein